MTELPRRLTLPSGRRVTLGPRRTERAGPTEPKEAAAPGGLFAEAIAVLEGRVQLADAKSGDPLPPRDLALADFHVLRAVLTKVGLLEEDEIEIGCVNCDEVLVVRPCSGLELGPWKDGELDDPELDATAELEVPLPIATIGLGRVRAARTVTLTARTVRQAEPLFLALARDPVRIDEAFVGGMGVVALGQIREPGRIASALASADDAAFETVTDTFLAAHYPLRLSCDVLCSACGARNTIDAPYLREFELGRPGTGDEDDADGPPLPSLETFVELAHAIADPLIAELPGEKPALVVESGTPAVDDGGAPLLGSYVPPPPRDAPVPTHPPLVTVYWKTFEAIEREEAPWDWEGELRETIEHELEHHVYFLRGDDPMDEEEREEIAREVVRVVGRGEVARRTVAGFGLSIPEFFVRAWPLVLVAAVVLAITLAESHCGP